MIDDLDQLIAGAVTEVFSTMLDAEPALGTSPPSPFDGAHIAASVGFAGALSGILYLTGSSLFARWITSRLLGLDSGQAADEALSNDAMGELANMIAGYLKSRLCDRGFPCALSIPSIVRGTNFQVESVSDTGRCSSEFSFPPCHRFAVEIILKNPHTHGTQNSHCR